MPPFSTEFYRLMLFLLLPFLLFSDVVQPVFLSELPGERIIRGLIVDSETGDPLPAANVIIEESYTGTISNPDGYYTLAIRSLPATVTVRYIGYNSETRVIDHDSENDQYFSLKPATVIMEEIVVTDRDPALSIMERVIERKKIWRDSLNNYKSEAYTRQVFENDTSIVSISESVSNAFWDSELGHREILKSQRRTSNLAETTNFTGVSYMPNFYDDNIEIAGFNMIGPTHPRALSYYNFKLTDQLMIDDRLVFEIEMEPRRRLQPAFRGTLYVLDREFALLEVRLKPNEVVRFPPPVQEFDLAYEQQFSNYGEQFWLPVDMRINGLVKIEMIGLRFPPIRFRQISTISEYEVNTELPDTLFQERRVFSVDTTTIDNEILVNTFPDRVPLTIAEEMAYETIDSTATLDQAFRPSGFLARAFIDDERDGRNRHSSFINRIFPEGAGINAHFNRIDGFHLGLNYGHSFERVSLRGHGGYNTHSGEWDYGAEADVNWFNSSYVRSSAVMGYSLSTDSRYNSRYMSWMNSLASLAGADDYFDYYRNESFKTGLQIDLPRQNLDTGIFYLREDHRTPDTEVYNYSLFGIHEMRRENPPVTDGQLRSLRVELGVNRGFENFGIAGNRSVVLNMEYSNPRLGSDFDFTRIEMSLNWNLQTFYQRRLLPNTLDLHFSAGTSTGELPLQRNFSIDGSLAGFTPFGVLKTRRNLPYEGDQYWLLYAEHNFRTLPFEMLGLHPLSERGWGFVLFAGAGESRMRSGFQPGMTFLPAETQGIHTEAGISLNSIFGIARLDFAKRLNASGFYIGFSVPRYF